MESLYFGGHVFHDPHSGFTLDMSGFADMSSAEAEYKEKCAVAMSILADIESGKIVNTSEKRAVDHYNHRKPEELLSRTDCPAKSLSKSLEMWDDVRRRISAYFSSHPTIHDVIFNGIGGSFLGPLMMYVACGDPKQLPRLHFVANTDPESFSAVVMHRVESIGGTLMVHMSKSGSTAETKGNMLAYIALLEKSGITSVGEHNMAITTRGSQLEDFARKRGFAEIFPMCQETGGRTSVVSAIGMVPCACAGIDFGGFLRGMSDMDVMTRRAEMRQNPAMMVAIGIERLKPRKNMIVLGYSDALREFAHYLQQLYMESLGKEFDADDRVVLHDGQTVFGGVGTGEQHAFMQQVQKGLEDCFVRFVSFRRRRADFAFPPSASGAGSMGRQLLGFLRGTQQALHENKRAYMAQTVEQCDMYNLGLLIALEERIVTFLAAFRHINAYDQPGVQDGKLAADGMNKLGNAMCQYILQLLLPRAADGKSALLFRGMATDFATAMAGVTKPAPSAISVDVILSDMEANISVEGSYDDLRLRRIAVRRNFNASGGFFVYEIMVGP